jgi:hypothetical protein
MFLALLTPKLSASALLSQEFLPQVLVGWNN